MMLTAVGSAKETISIDGVDAVVISSCWLTARDQVMCLGNGGKFDFDSRGLWRTKTTSFMENSLTMG